MAGRLEGKVAFITGAARGQGRSHALRLAEEGADIIAVDVCSAVDGVAYKPSTPEDLAETVRQVEKLDRRIVAREVDVRQLAALRQAVSDGVAELGRLDIICANAGISKHGTALELSSDAWQSVLDINLTGVWHAVKAGAPHIIAGGRGGSIILTSSVAGLKGYRNSAAYSAAKHGVIGLMRTLSQELGPESIRVNTVNPGNVATDMFFNPAVYKLFLPDVVNPTQGEIEAISRSMNNLPIPWLDPIEISNAVLFLASDESQYITGVALPVDAGALTK